MRSDTGVQDDVKDVSLGQLAHAHHRHPVSAPHLDAVSVPRLAELGHHQETTQTTVIGVTFRFVILA